MKVALAATCVGVLGTAVLQAARIEAALRSGRGATALRTRFGSARQHRPRPDPRDTGRYYAADRVHPSSASYRHCYDALTRTTPLREWLAAPSSLRFAA